MTTEIRTAAELGDIAGIEIACPKCTATMLLPVRDFKGLIPGQCVNCREPLIGQVAAEQIKLLITAMALLAAPNDGPKANIRIQLKPVPQK